MRVSLRYAVLGGVIAAVMGAAVTTVFQRQEMSRVLEAGKNHNLAVARLYAETMWPRYGPRLRALDSERPQSLKVDPVIRDLRRETDSLIRGTPVLRVNVYNRDGIVVFSTDSEMIGVDDGAHAHFLDARQGDPVTDFSQRGLFPNDEDGDDPRNILESYIPMGRSDGQVEVVFKLYFDAEQQLKVPPETAGCRLCRIYDRVCIELQDLLANPSVCAPYYL